jgi:hypothetical protein
MELDPSRTAEIDRKLKMSETILRFLIFKMEKIQIQNLHREITRRQENAAAAQQQQQQRAEAAAAAAATAATDLAAEEAAPASIEESPSFEEAPPPAAETVVEEPTETPAELATEPGQTDKEE